MVKSPAFGASVARKNLHAYQVIIHEHNGLSYPERSASGSWHFMSPTRHCMFGGNNFCLEKPYNGELLLWASALIRLKGAHDIAFISPFCSSPLLGSRRGSTIFLLPIPRPLSIQQGSARRGSNLSAQLTRRALFELVQLAPNFSHLISSLTRVKAVERSRPCPPPLIAKIVRARPAYGSTSLANYPSARH